MSKYTETLKSLHEGLVNKEFSSVELTKEAFKRIEEKLHNGDRYPYHQYS